MIYKLVSSKPGHVRVVFELPASLWAQLVYVVGDFDGRDHGATVPLSQERDGAWRLAIDLPEDRHYEYRYLIDGRWSGDLHARGGLIQNVESPKSLLDTTRIEEQCQKT